MKAAWGTTALAAAMSVTVAGLGRAEETIVSCDAFKAGWGPAWQRIDGKHRPLAFEPAGRGVDRLVAGSDVDARVTCLDGALSRVEIRPVGQTGPTDEGPEPVARAVAALLIALDPVLPPGEATGMVDAIRAESAVRSDAVSAWGPYEISWSRQPDGRPEVLVTLPEN